MSQPAVDLTNLRAITDGDRDLEKTLFEEFIISFDRGLNGLRASCEENASAAWRTHAHSLKGIAVNLGGMELGELCKIAQDNYTAASALKMETVEKITKEYQKVKEFLVQTMG